MRAGLRFGSRFAWTVAGALWFCAIAIGWVALGDYENSPGVCEPAERRWPTESSIQPSKVNATLVLFVHPKCPCTRASLGELEEIIARNRGKVTPWIVFLKPENTEPGWEKTDLWETAAALPGVNLVCDVAGREADCFHANTSGHAFLYGKRGELLFSGGITYSRGHAGDNAGQSAIEACLAGKQPDCQTTPVFGCPIATLRK